MRKRAPGPGRRRAGGAALALVAAGGALLLALGGCGQSGPLYLPRGSEPSPGATVPAPGFVRQAAAAGRGALQAAPVRPAHG